MCQKGSGRVARPFCFSGIVSSPFPRAEVHPRSGISSVVEGGGGKLSHEFPETTLFDLFTRFNLRDNDFLEGRYTCPDFVRVRDGNGECVVEAPCGTLYDFFKERAASGHCELLAGKTVSFVWNGRREREVA